MDRVDKFFTILITILLIGWIITGIFLIKSVDVCMNAMM